MQRDPHPAIGRLTPPCLDPLIVVAVARRAALQLPKAAANTSNTGRAAPRSHGGRRCAAAPHSRPRSGNQNKWLDSARRELLKNGVKVDPREQVEVGRFCEPGRFWPTERPTSDWECHAHLRIRSSPVRVNDTQFVVKTCLFIVGCKQSRQQPTILDAVRLLSLPPSSPGPHSP